MSIDEESTTGTATTLAQQRAGGEGVRFGMPLERSSDAASVSRRLADRMRPERFRIVVVVVLAAGAAGLTVAGPYLLGHATDAVVRGLSGPGGINTAHLTKLLLGALAVSVGSSAASYLVLHTIAGVVQRTMKQLRADVEDKLHRLPLAFVDGQPRGDLLSRVTNDVDNIAQSLQQTLGQLLTSTLSMTATIIIMLVCRRCCSSWFWSPCRPRCRLDIRCPAPSPGRFARQWRTTGRTERSGRRGVQRARHRDGFGRQREVQEGSPRPTTSFTTRPLDAQLVGGVMQPPMMVAATSPSSGSPSSAAFRSRRAPSPSVRSRRSSSTPGS